MVAKKVAPMVGNLVAMRDAPTAGTKAALMADWLALPMVEWTAWSKAEYWAAMMADETAGSRADQLAGMTVAKSAASSEKQMVGLTADLTVSRSERVQVEHSEPQTADRMVEAMVACSVAKMVEPMALKRVDMMDAHWAVTMVQSSAGRSADAKGVKTAA